MSLKNSIFAFCVNIALTCQVNAQVPQEISLKGNIESLGRSINRCVLTVSNSSSNFQGKAEKVSDLAVVYSAWIDGPKWQIATRDLSLDKSRDKDQKKWSSRFLPLGPPFSSSNLPPTGTILSICDGTSYSEFIFSPDREGVPWKGSHASWKLPCDRFAGFYLPYLRLKPSGMSSPIEILLTTSIPWEIELDNARLIATVPLSNWIPTPQNRHAGTFEMRQVWHVEFSTNIPYYPMRIETYMEYRLDGKVYNASVKSRKPADIFVIEEMKDFGDGLMLPASGSYTLMQMDPNSPEGRFDPDRIVSSLLEKGEFVSTAERWVSSKLSWVVHDASRLPKGTDLTFVPPDGSLLRTEDSTGITELIKGIPREKSDQLLGIANRPVPMGSRVYKVIVALASIVLLVLLVWKWRKKS